MTSQSVRLSRLNGSFDTFGYHVTVDEQARIDGQLADLGLGDAAMAKIAAKLDWQLDVNRVAALATSEDEATQIYATSLLVVDEGSPG